MPDAGRPQFLPPEEPPPDPPPADPPPPEGDARLLIVAVAGAAAVVVLAAVGVLLHGRSEALDTPSVTASLPPFVTGPPAYANTPDPCTSPGKAVPAEIRSAPRHKVADSCHWELLRKDKARDLTIEITLENGGGGTVKAAKDFADDLTYTGDKTANGGFEHGPEDLDALGDEAFAAHSHDLVERGPDKKSVISYDIGGVWAEARVRNVIVTVVWQGGDYPAGVRGHKKLVGDRLPYATAKRQATTMLKNVLAELR